GVSGAVDVARLDQAGHLRQVGPADALPVPAWDVGQRHVHTARLDGVQHRPEVIDPAATLLEVQHGRDGLVAQLVDEQISLPVRVTLPEVVIASKEQADFARPVTSTRPVGVPEAGALTDFRPHEVKSLRLDTRSRSTTPLLLLMSGPKIVLAGGSSAPASHGIGSIL